jgi:hypothetical protein
MVRTNSAVANSFIVKIFDPQVLWHQDFTGPFLQDRAQQDFPRGRGEGGTPN